MNLMKKLIDPSDVIIEKTAGEMAGVFYDAARSSGMKFIRLQEQTINLLRYKTPRAFARAHLEKFIPAAVHALTDILSRPETPEPQKRIVYDALMERVNDPQLEIMGKAALLPEYEKTVLYKADNEKPKPLIVTTERKANG